MTNPNLKTTKTKPHGKPWASRLCAFEAQIRAWRRGLKTYQEISELLRQEHGLEVSRQAISDFVRVRAKRRPYELPEPGALTALGQGPALGVAPQPALPAKANTGPVAAPSSTPTQPARRGMLPPSDNKHRDKYGAPVAPPPNPNDFRSENL